MVLPPITTLQQKILLLLYRFRFLDRKQIQTLLHHKTFNRINVWLKDLTEKKYIGRIVDTESKINIVPAKYYLSVNGIRHLKSQSDCEIKYLSKLYRESKRSEAFINQCLFIADIYLYLQKKYAHTTGFSFYTQSEYSLHGLIKELFPLFVFRKRGDEPYYVAEIFKENMPRKKAIRPRIERYIEFFSQDKWLQNELPPKILFICPDTKMKSIVIKDTKQILDNEDVQGLSIYATTKEQIQKQNIEDEIWEKVEE